MIKNITELLQKDGVGSMYLIRKMNLEGFVRCMKNDGNAKECRRRYRGLIKGAICEEYRPRSDKYRFDTAIPIWSVYYPRRLFHLDSPPIMLFCKGDRNLLYLRPGLGVVGSRAMTRYGSRVVERLVGYLAKLGVSAVSDRPSSLQLSREVGRVVVISGMARGVDSKAHNEAVRHGLPSIGVVPGSLAGRYVDQKRSVYGNLVSHGLLVSEFPAGRGEFKGMFPMRNRIIAALSDAVLVVEAGLRSGALNTVSTAVSLGKEVGAVPGGIFNPGSVGTNMLIAQGAMMIRDKADLMELLNINIEVGKRSVWSSG